MIGIIGVLFTLGFAVELDLLVIGSDKPSIST
jgi:hypothetical protein